MSSGTITLRRPSGSGRRGAVRESGAAVVREADEGARGALLPELYLHGLAEGDFELAMQGTARRGGAAVEVFDPQAQGRVVE